MKIDSKEMKVDGEISHASHPQHMLKLQNTQDLFMCDGCKELGIGLRYECEQCNFDLHKTCAMGPPDITHPLFGECEFRLHLSPPGNASRVCDACMDDVLGLVYHCKRRGFDLHPCCANLPQVLHDGERNLYLCHKMSGSCGSCGVRGSGWSYRSECKKYNYHVSCVKKMLMENLKDKTQDGIDENIQVMTLQVRNPKVEGTLQRHQGGKAGKVWKYCKNIAIAAVSVIVAAILGDPAGMIIAVVGALRSK